MILLLSVLVGLASTTSALPLSDCYALDKENYLYDFTDKVGKELELEEETSDFVLRFCIDAQNRSNKGYVNYGRFLPQIIPKHGKDDADFYQVYKYGDLRLCEHIGNDFIGREAEVEIICGTCFNGAICKDDFGCICNTTYYHSLCKVKVLAAVDCSSRGPRIYSDFSIGFQPRGSEVVKNGITQKDYRKAFYNQSFESNQASIFLYITSTTGSLNAVEKAMIQVQPSQGLFVRIVNKATLSISSATKTITFIQIDWKCVESQEQLYEVNISIPIDGYDPVDFFLYKQCRTYDNRKHPGVSTTKILGAISLMILIGMTIIGTVYKCKLHKQPKSNAETGVPLISDTLDEVSLVEDTLQHTMEVPMA